MPSRYVWIFISALGAAPAGAGILTDAPLPETAQAARSLVLVPQQRPAPAETGAPAAGTDPLSRAAGHAMWDPLGHGCVDGGDPDAPFPAGKGDLRAAPFCLPHPCARALTREELSREVVGRPLREGEWDRYMARYAAACRNEAVWPEEAPLPEWASGPATLLSGAVLTSGGLGPASPSIAGIDMSDLGVPGSGPWHRHTPLRPPRPVDEPSPDAAPPKPATPPAPIPLPPVLPLLASALAALGLLRRYA